MRDELNQLMNEELEAIQFLLKCLDEQYKFIVKNDIFGMEGMTGKLENASKNIARLEVQRRELTHGESMSKLIRKLNDSEAETTYREMRRLLEETRLQKDTNELLIRQGLGYTTRILSILNPDRSAKTYNTYGKLGRR